VLPAHRTAALLAAISLGTAACFGRSEPPPSDTLDASRALDASRPYELRLEAGPWDDCTIVVRARQALRDDDAEELEDVLTDWYNLARLGAFRDEAQGRGEGAADGMGAPWRPGGDSVASRFNLGTMSRRGFSVLLNALEGYHDEQAPLREVVLCADVAPPPPATGGST
jgi:hypothetical protein